MLGVYLNMADKVKIGAGDEQVAKMQKLYMKTAERKTKKFMKSATAFLATKLTGSPDGQIPDEFELSLMLLESYYKQFILLDLQINDLDSLVVMGRYGWQGHALLPIRDKACVRLESLMKQMGLTLKSGKQLGATEVKKEESELDKFFKEKAGR